MTGPGRRRRGVPVDIGSPLTVDQAAERLRADLPRRSLWLTAEPVTIPRITGRVDGDRVELVPYNQMYRNPFRPTFRGRLAPDGDGSRLVGVLEPDRALVVAAALALVGLAALATVLLIVDVILSLAAGDLANAGGAAIAATVTTGAMLFGGLVRKALSAAGARSGDYLIAWVTERLRPPLTS
jgi:hypothetical protein